MKHRISKKGEFRITDGEGRVISVTPLLDFSPPRRICCVPCVGRDGIEFRPDWSELTEFG